MERLVLFNLLFLGVIISRANAGLIINEIMADPSSSGGNFDSNNDGLFDSSDDEYIEIVNSMTTSFDLSGFQLADSSSMRHVFASGTILNGGQAAVVFGGGTPTGTFGGSLAFAASTGSLILNNTGDTVSILDPFDALVDTYTYGSEGGQDTSLSRNPDITGVVFSKHVDLPGSLAGSPGVRIDGARFAAVPEPSAFMLLGLIAIVAGIGTRFIRRKSTTQS